MKKLLSYLLVLSLFVCTGAVSESSIIQKGDSGNAVLAMQKILSLLNYLSVDYVNSEFDDMTELAVFAFQLDHGIEPTGIIDKETQHTIIESHKDMNADETGTNSDDPENETNSTEAITEDNPEFSATDAESARSINSQQKVNPEAKDNNINSVMNTTAMDHSLYLSLEKCSVGDIIDFGSYEQDNDSSNGSELIEWIVLSKDDKSATLISKYVLDCIPYNNNSITVTWETCTLRKWLNSVFINEAFSVEEQKIILPVSIPSDPNLKYETNSGNETNDRVFILSIREAEQLLKDNSMRICKATPYAIERGTQINDTCACYWWLRSPGATTYTASNVKSDGSISFKGYDVSFEYRGIRPAITISLLDDRTEEITDNSVGMDSIRNDIEEDKPIDERYINVDYTDVERYPGKYKGMKVKIYGTVIQVSEGWFNSVVLRVDQGQNKIWYAEYIRKNENEQRILENDRLTFFGRCEGIKTYTSVLGSTISIPAINVDYYQ